MMKLKRPVPLPRKKVSVTAPQADTTHSSSDHVTSPGNHDNSDQVTYPGDRSDSDHMTSCGNHSNSDHVTSSGNHTNSDHMTSSGNHSNSDHVTSSGNHTNSDHMTSSGNHSNSDRVTSSGNHTNSDRVTSTDSIGFHSYVNLIVLDDEGGSDEDDEGGSDEDDEEGSDEDDALLQEDSDKEEMHQYLKPAPPRQMPEYLEILPPGSLLPCQPEEPSYLKVLPQSITPSNDVTDDPLAANLETRLSPFPAVVAPLSPHDLEDLALSGRSSYSPLWRDQDSPDFESLPFDLNKRLESSETGEWASGGCCLCVHVILMHSLCYLITPSILTPSTLTPSIPHPPPSHLHRQALHQPGPPLPPTRPQVCS